MIELKTILDLRKLIRHPRVKQIKVATRFVDGKYIFVQVSKRRILDSIEHQSKWQKLTPGVISFDEITGTLYL